MPLTVGTRPKRPARTELFWAVDRVDRLRLCAELVQAAGRVVIVCRSQSDASRLAGELSRLGVPAASIEHRDFGAPRVRAQVVTDESTIGCARNGAACVIQFDPALTARRHRRRIELLATPRALVVSLVVPERVGDARVLLADLDLPDVLGGPDLAVARRALLVAQNAAPAAPASRPSPLTGALERVRGALGAAGRAMRAHLPGRRASGGSARGGQATVHRDQRAS